MSIWVTIETVGVDDHGEHDRSVLAVTHPSRYPDPDQDEPALVDLATVPAFLVPGREDDFDSRAVGPWLRLALADGRVYTEVTLNPAAATTLRDALDAWLDLDHIHPKEAP